MTSLAGMYDSVLGVAGSEAVAQAIDRVIDSFEHEGKRRRPDLRAAYA